MFVSHHQSCKSHYRNIGILLTRVKFTADQTPAPANGQYFYRLEASPIRLVKYFTSGQRQPNTSVVWDRFYLIGFTQYYAPQLISTILSPISFSGTSCYAPRSDSVGNFLNLKVMTNHFTSKDDFGRSSVKKIVI